MIAEYLKQRRWFRGKARTLREAHVEEVFPLELAGTAAPVSIVLATYEDGGSERYVLFGENDATTHHDALADARLLSPLIEKLRGGGTRVDSGKGQLVFRPLSGFEDVKAASMTPMPSAKEQSNTSVPFGDAYILKILRKLDDGRSAELEMGEFLTKKGYASAPPVLAAIEIERGRDAEPATIGIVHRFVPNRGDAWTFTCEALERSNDPEAYATYATLLGRRISEMHAVLASATDPAFAPEPLDRGRRIDLAERVRESARAIAAHLGEGDEAKIAKRVQAFVEHAGPDPIATRVHGDLHLGQILVAEERDDFVIIDFEGEPARPLAERKAKRSPMADVAGMLRSFDYAAATHARSFGSSARTGRDWYREVTETFLRAYGEVSRDVLDFYLIEKCIYEIGYEANNRPDWVAIPLGGLRELLA